MHPASRKTLIRRSSFGITRPDSFDLSGEDSQILKYEMGNLIIKPLEVTEMLQIEDDNVRTDWKKAEKHTRFQDSKLKKVVQSSLRNKPLNRRSLVHLFEALQHVDHDQQLTESRNLQSILNFGFMSAISDYFKKISLFSLTIYDITNRRFLRLVCKPAVLAHTVFIDDVTKQSPRIWRSTP